MKPSQDFITLTQKNIDKVSALLRRDRSELQDILDSHSEYEIKAGRVRIPLPVSVHRNIAPIHDPIQTRYPIG